MVSGRRVRVRSLGFLLVRRLKMPIESKQVFSEVALIDIK